MEIDKIEAFKVIYDAVVINYPAMDFKERVTLVNGANGSGKSTLLKKISGVFDRSLSSQFRYALEIPIFPLDLTVSSLLNAFLNYDEHAEITTQNNLIKRFNFSEFLDHKCNELSKGNKMKLSLIITLQSNVKLYLLDEPFSGLDKSSRLELIRYIQNSSSQFIITTHRRSELFTMKVGVINL